MGTKKASVFPCPTKNKKIWWPMAGVTKWRPSDGRWRPSTGQVHKQRCDWFEVFVSLQSHHPPSPKGAKCQAPASGTLMMPEGGAVPNRGHCHGGIMSGLPTTRNFFNPPPFTSNPVGDNQPTYLRVEDSLLKRWGAIYDHARNAWCLLCDQGC